MDRVDEFIACLILTVTFNGESRRLEQACEMQLRALVGQRRFELLTGLFGCVLVSRLPACFWAPHSVPGWSKHWLFSISCIFYFLASCGFCGAVGPVRRPSQGSLHKEWLQSMPVILSVQLCLVDKQIIPSLCCVLQLCRSSWSVQDNQLFTNLWYPE